MSSAAAKDESFDVFGTERTKRLTSDGGVLKEILKEGSGERPGEGCACDLHYVGRLKDGTIFDSSRKRKKPFRMILGEKTVIKGWNVVVRTMRGGETCRVVISPTYAYGEEGKPPTIPARATLIFEMELMCWYSNPKCAPSIKSDPEPLSVRRKKELAMKRRVERVDALTEEEERIKARASAYERSRSSQIEDILRDVIDAKEEGNKYFKAKDFSNAIASYERSIESARLLERSVASVVSPRRPEGVDEEEEDRFAGLVDAERRRRNDYDARDRKEAAPQDVEDDDSVTCAEDVISRTVEEATLTKDVKERLARLEGTSLSGAHAAATNPDMADRLIHRLMTRELNRELRERLREIHATVLTNVSASLFRLKRFSESHNRADEALRVSRFHRKALYRRGMARARMVSTKNDDDVPSTIERSAAEDLAAALILSEPAASKTTVRIALFETALRDSAAFFAPRGVDVRSTQDRGQSCFATRAFRAGEVLWQEAPCMLHRVSAVRDETVAHRDALSVLFRKHTTSDDLVTFAGLMGRLLALHPTRTFVEKRLGELKKSKSSRRKTSSEAASWVSDRYGDESNAFDLTPSFLQRMKWAMDSQSKAFVNVVFEPLDHDDVVKLLLETFTLNGHDMDIGGFAVGRHSSFVNHSCWPNVDAHVVEPSSGTVVRAIRDICAGEEILMSYVDLYELKEKRMQALYQHWGFVCKCPRCANDKEFDGKTPALADVDSNPFVASGRADGLKHHDRIFVERFEKIQHACTLGVARGRSTDARRDALTKLSSWLDDARHFYARRHPTRFRALHAASMHAFRLLRVKDGLRYVRECDEIYASMHPTHWPWGRHQLTLIREIALRVLGGEENVSEAERCAAARRASLDVHAASSSLWTSCGVNISNEDRDVVEILMRHARDTSTTLPEELRKYVSSCTKRAEAFEATKRRWMCSVDDTS